MTDREPDAIDLYPAVADAMLRDRTRPGMTPTERLAEVLDVAGRAWDAAVGEEHRRHWDRVAEELGV